MTRFFKRIALSLFGSLMVIGLSGNIALAGSYNPLNRACTSGDLAQTSSVCRQSNDQQGKSTNPAVTMIAKTAKVMSLIIGFASIIIIVVAGLNLITSGGSPENVKSAKSRIVSAIVGLIIAALAWILASFIIGALI